MRARRVESFSNTQRFRVYKQIVKDTIGPGTFEHLSYEYVSGYLLINVRVTDIAEKESLLIKMLSDTYENLLEI